MHGYGRDKGMTVIQAIIGICGVSANIHTADPRLANYIEAIKSNCHSYYANCLKDDESPEQLKECMKSRRTVKIMPIIEK